MRIGVVDLDTSHPQLWIPIERQLGHEVVGVWDGGSVHPPEYVKDFAKQYELGRVYDSLESMVEDVDCAIIHGCDWDTHVDKARPFVEAGKSVLLDKPQAGNLRDLRQLCHWAENGVRITGGSCLYYCYETQHYLKRPLYDRGTPHTIMGGCGVDEFNYGIHAYAHVCGILGPGIQKVRHLGRNQQRQIQLQWQDGKTGILTIGQTEQWLPFHATVVTERTVTQILPQNHTLYQALLEITLPYLAGQADKPAVGMSDLIEPELAALAARRSWTEGDRWVSLAELTEEEGYDGQAFVDDYRKQKYPET